MTDMPIREQLEQDTAGTAGEALIDVLFDFISQRGQSNYDESVTQIQHALQCAQLAQTRGFGDEAVTSALLHDIGHLLVDEHDAHQNFLDQDMNHEDVGANLLDKWFPEKITDPIRLHVAAKRYLCSTDPAYYEQLSEASKRSFKLQGGSLTPQEQEDFERNPHLPLAVELRRLDDLGKRPNQMVPAINDFKATVSACLRPEFA
ncbi:MAG: HD domain-containing protein [Planctomycetota bacterium]|nr:HD domain-containing protein [Planctomycetota bacterium]